MLSILASRFLTVPMHSPCFALNTVACKIKFIKFHKDSITLFQSIGIFEFYNRDTNILNCLCMLFELDSSIRYTSNYYRTTKVDLMKARPNHSSLQRNGCTGITVPGPELLPPQYPELRGTVYSLLPSTAAAAAGELKISAQGAVEGTRQLLKQWELAALAPFQLLHGTALPAFDKSKQPPNAEKGHLRQRTEKKQTETLGLGLIGSTGA